ncbi:MAG: carboxylating nicotinate-nucleotide diphosphorylase [Rickettsiales bacterium]|nr:carboxylating nicotinate-nucleotide diphosphorylase [Rickettsiales bacterium]
MQINFDDINEIISNALEEDIGRGDVTSNLTIPEDANISAKFIFREDAIFCGTPILENIFLRYSEKIKFIPLVKEGSFVQASQAVFEVSGNARIILQSERVALNFIQRMSGIATLTNKFVEKTKGTKAQILDTRKTTPNLRKIERYSVWIGGGVNHRYCLDDAVLIKDNHIAFNNGDIQKTIRLAKNNAPEGFIIEVECDNLEQFKIAIQEKPDIILLDNMNINELKQAVELAKNTNILLEASGGVTLETIKEIAETGVDRISIGSLTHSVKSIDIGLDF